MKPHHHRLSDELAQLAQKCDGPTTTLGELLENTNTRAHALGSLVLSLPFLTPIPLPGLSILFGAGIAIIGIRMMLGKGIWLPNSWMKRPFPSKLIRKILGFGERWSRKLERWVRPRGHFFHSSTGVRLISGTMIIICGALLALPLPPGTNFPPALVIVLLSIGNLEEDGVLVVLGFIAFLINMALFVYVPTLAIQSFRGTF